MIEVFKTNVNHPEEAGKLLAELQQLLPQAAINFDLQDCDRVLRIDTVDSFQFNAVQQYVIQAGYICEVLL